jgi:predicted NAD/FAD-binding protein
MAGEMTEQRIAVVGGGISGLGAAWLLSRRHHVSLLEAEDRVGGHTNTVDCPTRGDPVPVDTGFIVYNEPNYPHLSALFRALQVPTHASDMSFAFSARDVDLEYAGDNLRTLFAQRRNLLRPAFWRMSTDILRFNRAANARLDEGIPGDITLGRLLDDLEMGEPFRRYYLLPMSAAIWSCPQDDMLGFPAERFLRFFRNHGLIQLADRPPWRTVTGGAREYVKRMLPAIPQVLTGTPVRRIERRPDGAYVYGDAGLIGRFDAVVIGAHADQALAMLERPSFWERTLLGAFRYQENIAWLHGDPALMPRRRSVWSSWNHLTEDIRDGRNPVAVSYWMNRLQPLSTDEDVFVTLNPPRPPAAEHAHRRIVYQHPVFDQAAIRAQRLLPRIQGRDRVWFCGSYQGYGFHEDGLRSAVEVARAFGVTPPWEQVSAPSRPVVDAAVAARGMAR